MEYCEIYVQNRVFLERSLVQVLGKHIFAIIMIGPEARRLLLPFGRYTDDSGCRTTWNAVTINVYNVMHVCILILCLY